MAFSQVTGRVPAASSAATVSLQSGLPEEHRRVFESELDGWFDALKWLVKEFRLRVGYETPDEEAGIQFWIDRYERQRGPILPGPSDPKDQNWDTADEPAMPGTADEAAQARRWVRAHVSRRMAQFFELKRRLCPHAPVLVPLQQLEHYDKPRYSSVAKQHAALHQFREPTQQRAVVQPPEARQQERRASTPGKARASPGKVMSRETANRLFPMSIPGAASLTDAQFASRVVDLAIEFDGDAERAVKEGVHLITRGAVPANSETSRNAGFGAVTRHWIEGRHQLQELNLLMFWARLNDKASLGLIMAAARATQILEERVSGHGFGAGVMSVFKTRFNYECLDAGVLYRFWLSMPKAVRSAHHIRGYPDHEAFQALNEEVQLRAEIKRAEEAIKPAPGAPDAATLAARAAVLPYGEPSATGLEVLAQPKARRGALPHLQMLARQFPQDPVLRRMLRQCLDGRLPWRGLASMDYEVYDLFHETNMRNRYCMERKGSQEEAKKSPLATWLVADADRARKTLESMKEAHGITKKIDAFLMQAATRYLARGASRVCELGPYFASTKHHPRDLRGVMLIEDLFVQTCRDVGDVWEVLARFGAHYLPIQRGVAPGSLRAPGFPAVPGRGGPTTDCATCRARADASSCAPGCSADFAVDGLAATGWMPEPFVEAQVGKAWWDADLGKLHSCVGVTLQWSLPRRKTAIYVDKSSLAEDLRLEGGRGEPIKVTYVHPGGASAAAGVTKGDLLKIGVGGDSDRLFLTMPPGEALAQLQFPARLVFEGADAGDDVKKFLSVQLNAQKDTQVKISASKTDEPPTADDYEEACSGFSLRAAPGKSVDIPALFVGRWVRLDFPGAWPHTADGQAFLLSVRVIKVWRLAPPTFRQRFLDALRRRLQPGRPLAKPSGGGGGEAVKAKKLRGPFLPFWASAKTPRTFNRKIQEDIERGKRRLHDYEDIEEELFRKDEDDEDGHTILEKLPTEFHMLRSGEYAKWKQHIYAREDDARECTFHPKSSVNVPRHVMEERSKIIRGDTGERSVERFAKDLGVDFKSAAHNNYVIVNRRMTLSRARRDYANGFFMTAWKKLEAEFGVQQILDRFTCYKPGCGAPLDFSIGVCRCTGYYCHRHTDPDTHACKEMKAKLVEKARAFKEKSKESGGLPEEQFEKWQFGLIQEVYQLAAAIRDARKARRRQRRSLEQLGQSLKQYGAVRLLERPFRTEMCQRVLANRRSWSADGGANVPFMGPTQQPLLHSECGCHMAHKPSELRFPRGESISRREAWIDEAISRSKHIEDTLPGSEAERSKVKSGPDKDAKKPRSNSAASSRRARSVRRVDALRRSLDERARDANQAQGLVHKARAKLHDGNRSEARQLTNEARKLAGKHVGKDLDGISQPAAKAAPASPNRQDLRAQIRALAGGDAISTSLPTPLRRMRDCERDELQRGEATVQREVYDVLGSCRELDSELRRRQQAQERDDQLLLRAAEVQLQTTLPNVAGTASPSSPVRSGERPQMCITFLEAGTCARGDTCPYAHHPAELSGRSHQSLEGLLQLRRSQET